MKNLISGDWRVYETSRLHFVPSDSPGESAWFSGHMGWSHDSASRNFRFWEVFIGPQGESVSWGLINLSIRWKRIRRNLSHCSVLVLFEIYIV